MAQFSLTIGRWRMLRMATRKKKSHFDDLRNMARHDQEDVAWLVEIGYLTDLGDGYYALTPKGVEASDMGYYEMDVPATSKPAAKAPKVEPTPEPPKKGKGKGKKK